MTPMTSFDRIGVVVARGTGAQVKAARAQPGVTYLEGNTPIESASRPPTRPPAARRRASTLTGADGRRSTARASPSPSSTRASTRRTRSSGRRTAHRSRQQPQDVCDPRAPAQVLDVPDTVDTDTLSGGGHGTHVNGIVAGRPTTLTDGRSCRRRPRRQPRLDLDRRRAPDRRRRLGAELGAREPRRAVRRRRPGRVPADQGHEQLLRAHRRRRVRPESATVKLQRALAAEGVVTVWADGNDGGDGSASLTNPPGQDPTGGIISVASYYDQGTGTRDGDVSEFSSRGAAGDPST